MDFTFGPGVSRRCVNVTIANDDILEGEEDFFSTLTTTDLDVLLIPNEAQVVIADNNSTFYYIHPVPVHCDSIIRTCSI